MQTTQMDDARPPTAYRLPPTVPHDRLERIEAWTQRMAHAYGQLAALAADAPLLDTDLQESTAGLAQHAAGVLAQAERAARHVRALYEGAAEESEPTRLDRVFGDLPPRTFGQRLRRARLARGLTQKELAGQTGVDWRQVQRWEADTRRPRPAALRSLAGALQVQIATLLGEGP